MVMQSGTSKGGMTPPDRNESDDAAELLESQESQRTLSQTAKILWLVVFGIIMFFLPLYVFDATVREDAKTLEKELASVRIVLTTVPTARPEIQRLLTPLAQTQAQANQINSVYSTLIAPRPNLPAVMASINNYNVNDITLTSLTLDDKRITLSGRAVREEHIIAYVHVLEQSNLFTRVTLQSAQVAPTITPTLTIVPTSRPVPPTPTIPPPTQTRTPVPIATYAPPPTPVPNTPIPTSTSTATWTPTPSATPDLRDAYEPDDTSPKFMAVGETQPHNFYPARDVDLVGFAAKANRYYQVLTSDLALGVDTVVTVTMDNEMLGSNDDHSPGSGNFASAVCFQSPRDGDIVVAIINKTSFYGPERTYKIKVSEGPKLTAPPCSAATPAAWQMPGLVSISAKTDGNDFAPSFIATSRLNASSSNHVNETALIAPMPVRFVIILELKAVAP